MHKEATLPLDTPYLPALLQHEGYNTVSVSNNAYISTAYGFARGFDTFHEYFRVVEGTVRKGHRTPVQQAEFVWNRYLEPAVREAGERPFFIYLHEIDPHFPYAPPPPYDSMYDFGYQGNVLGYETSLRNNMDFINLTNKRRAWVEEADIRYIRSQYAGEITFMDEYLGLLLGRLDKAGLSDRTLVVFVSDHGEQLFEHQRGIGHGDNVYQELLAVPMIFALPGVLPAGRRPRAHAQLIDVPPTILDLLGLEAPPSMQGRSLLPAILAPETYQPDQPSFASSLGGFDSIRFRNWKLIRRSLLSQREFFLYDLDDDPHETFDRWPTQPIIGHTLSQILSWQHLLDARSRFQQPPELDADPGIIENLKALGYLE